MQSFRVKMRESERFALFKGKLNRICVGAVRHPAPQIEHPEALANKRLTA